MPPTTGEKTPEERAAEPVPPAPPRRVRLASVCVGLFLRLNEAVARRLRAIEMTGVLMRIFSFSLVSWQGPDSPFLFVWSFNTIDAVMLSWCAALKRDAAYTLLNVFWIGVGVVGIIRASGMTHP